MMRNLFNNGIITRLCKQKIQQMKIRLIIINQLWEATIVTEVDMEDMVVMEEWDTEVLVEWVWGCTEWECLA